MSRIIPIIFNIHVEPEQHFIDLDKPSYFYGFEQAFKEVEEVRQRFRAKGQPFNVQWLLRMDDQIKEVYGDVGWCLKYYKSEIEHLRTQGDEVGVHLHVYQWDECINNWKVDFTDRDYINGLIDQGVEVYKDHMGEKPKSICMGDQWMNNETMNHIEKSGFKYELTAASGRTVKQFPMFIGQYYGQPANYETMPKYPYHPNLHDFCKEDNSSDSKLWVIPLTTGKWKKTSHIKGIIRSVIQLKNFNREVPKIDKFQVSSGIDKNQNNFINKIQDDKTSHFAFEVRSALFSRKGGIKSFHELIDFFSKEIESNSFHFTTSDQLVNNYLNYDKALY